MSWWIVVYFLQLCWLRNHYQHCTRNFLILSYTYLRFRSVPKVWHQICLQISTSWQPQWQGTSLRILPAGLLQTSRKRNLLASSKSIWDSILIRPSKWGWCIICKSSSETHISQLKSTSTSCSASLRMDSTYIWDNRQLSSDSIKNASNSRQRSMTKESTPWSSNRELLKGLSRAARCLLNNN